jgi:hypothetical protein
MAKAKTTAKDAPAAIDGALLARAADFYHKSYAHSRKAFDCLRKRCLAVKELLEPYSCGYCDGKLTQVLPTQGPVTDQLTAMGVLDENGDETLLGCLVFPLFDAEDAVLSLWGHHLETGEERLITSAPTALWNLPAARPHPEILLAGTVFDGLSLIKAGYPNVLALATEELHNNDPETLAGLGVQTILLIGDTTSLKQAAERLSAFTLKRLAFPESRTPNELLVTEGADALAAQVEALRSGDSLAPVQPGLQTTEAGFATRFGPRGYEIRGLDKGSRRLKATVRVEHAGRLHVDTLDLYSAKARRNLCRDLCRLFEEPVQTIETDLARLIRLCEQHDETAGRPDISDPVLRITPKDRKEAEQFGKSPDLLERIAADYEACGLVGEEANKLLCYLAAVSRKTDDPLSVMILSSSGAGKSALQDATLLLCPPEDVVKLTSLSGKALFYKGRRSLKHKILALEEDAGAEEAAYAVRNLISAKELVIETTTKDLGSGRLTTVTHRVEGPTAVFVTTTNPEPEPETRSRFFLTSVDESRKQTRAILERQRQRHTLEGQAAQASTGDAIRRNRNFQRLLKPLVVVNPHASELVYSDDRLQSRRDQPKYLNLIRAVAFLRQFQKKLHKHTASGQTVEYIEVDREDIRIADRVACEIMGRSLDDLNAVSRNLLVQLEKMVRARLRKDPPPESGDDRAALGSVEFTRREIREFTGWPHVRVHRYLKQLIDQEYVLESSRGRGRTSFRLAYEGQGKDGSRFVLGLNVPEENREK